MFRRILPLILVLPLLVAGCKKSSTLAKLEDKSSVASPGASVPPAQAEATPTPPPAIDRSAKVIVFCYHRFEDNPRDTLAIAPAEFRTQMKQLKDDGIAVIPMKISLPGGEEKNRFLRRAR
jgi:hypothetical protein